MSALPATIARLERQWSVRVERGLPGGSSSWVGRARLASGAPQVVKIAVPSYDLAAEAAALAAADGDGYVRLLAYEPEVNAVLLEALGPTLERSGLPPSDQLAVLADVLVHAWRRPVADLDRAAVTGPTKARTLAASIADGWERQGRPCPEAVVRRALDAAATVAAAWSPDRCVWVHGDAHPGNVLRADERPGAPGGWVLIDPDPFLDDPCYDLGVALRDWAGRLEGPDAIGWLRERCAELAARTGEDAELVWSWAYLERVSTGIYVRSFGAEALGQRFLDTAARLL